jgi:hypothetical protein
MSMHRRDRISRVDAERLLDTGIGGPEALEALLAAAAPSPASGELAGEHAALTQFRAGHLATVPSRRRTALFKSVLANLAAAKVALAATAAAAATGGIALAASTGNLPGTSQGAAHAHQPAPVAVSESAEHGAAPAGETESAEPSASEAARPSTTPSPSLNGLCKAFQAGATDNPGKALDNPAFSVLVAKAGGKDQVADFCVTRVGPAPTHPAGAPTTHPTGRPASHPGAHPTHPTGAPATHPSGAPTPPERP